MRYAHRALAVAGRARSLADAVNPNLRRGVTLGQRVYNFDLHPKAGLAVADYTGHTVRILPDPVARPRDRIVLDAVTVGTVATPLRFPHTAMWLDERRLVLTLSKVNAAAPKRQGMTLVVDVATRVASRLDDVFEDRELETFPDFAGPCGDHIAVSYAGINAVMLFTGGSELVRVIGEAGPVRGLLRPRAGAALETMTDIPLDNPHGVVRLDESLFVADTGNGRIIRQRGDDVAVLEAKGDGAFAWTARRASEPCFDMPISVRAYDGRLFFNDFGSGILYRVEPATEEGVVFRGEESCFPSATDGPRVKFFDFAQLEQEWLINEGTSGIIRTTEAQRLDRG